MTDAALERRLAAAEAAALAVYARHGLPVRPGHYRRGPRAARWTWLGESLDPGDRWARVLERPAGRGWRFGTLEAVGADDPRPEVAAAARRLADCRLIRQAVADGAAQAAAEALIRLGSAPPRAARRSTGG